jgi:DNA-directed RNA polymerase subunit B'
MSEVYLNGKYVGLVENGQDFVQQFRNDRRKGIMDSHVSVRYDEISNSIYVECGRGRVMRPLIVVREGQSLLTEKHIKQLFKSEIGWNDLLEQGIIEFLDASEEENALVAFDEKDLTTEHTHLEITSLSMLGMTTALVPFGNYIPSARLNAGSKNQKQSIGIYAANYEVRIDMDVNLLHYPQIPVVTTAMHDIAEYDKHPSGQNVVVAVLSHRGYNMEDAIVVNRASIDRGFGRSSYFRPALAEELRYSGGLMDTISVPDKDVKGYKSERDYRFLEDDGIVYPEARVREEDVVIGKTSPPRFLSGTDEYSLGSNTRRESSVSIPHGEEGVVDFVLITENEEGNRLVSVRLRDQKIPEIGDKFTSRHGQKGVIGLIVEPADMPFSANGSVPDILFSPHGIPSRMTVSHLLDLVCGKVGCLSGRYVDGTTFHSEKEDAIRQELESLGFRESGVETLYNGMTGEKFDAHIYIGDMYYHKLKHMVSNKLHSRARGPIQLLTRQPTEGRAKEGGLRLGEMEKDTFVAHGAALLLKERFDADRTLVPISEETNNIAIFDGYKGKLYDPLGSENAEINWVEMSYAFKLLLEELKTLGIYPKIVLENKY